MDASAESGESGPDRAEFGRDPHDRWRGRLSATWTDLLSAFGS